MSTIISKTKGHKTRKLLMLALLVVLVAGLLAACGDNATATTQPAVTGGSNSPTTATATATATPQPTAQSDPTAAPITSSAPATTTTVASQPGYKPVISFSSNSLKIGDNLVVSGSGYPANANLKIVLTTTSVADGDTAGAAVTDGKGKFSKTIQLNLNEGKVSASKGRVVVAVGTEDWNVAASAAVSVTLKSPAFKPVLNASALSFPVGKDVTLTGSGYPPNVVLQMGGGVQNTNENYGTVKTDGQGNFSKTVTVPENVTLGLYFIYATTSDFKYQAKVELNLLPAERNYTPALKIKGTTAPNPPVVIGTEITISGSGYPANTELVMNGGVQNPVVNYGTVKTDGNGNFTKTVKMDHSGIGTGLFIIYVSTPDFKYQANVSMSLVVNL